MKTSISILQKGVLWLLMVIPMSMVYSQVDNAWEKAGNKPETDPPKEIYWHVKAFQPEAQLLKIKAIDGDVIYDIKAIQDANDTSILNVKALVNGKRLPVKLIVKENERYFPVKAITANGTLMDVKAITPDGDLLDVKGIERNGNTVSIMAIGKDGSFYKVIAVSPDGSVNTVKGVKMMENIVEGMVNGVSIYAHIKAMH